MTAEAKKPEGAEVISLLFKKAEPFTPPPDAPANDGAAPNFAGARPKPKEGWEDGPPADHDAPPPDGPADGPPSGGGKSRGGGGHRGGRLLGLMGVPDDCPVIPLGRKGRTFFYLDADQQLQALEDREHNNNTVISLFGKHMRYVYAQWPRFGKGRPGQEPPIIGWDGQACRESLMAACSERGLWDPFNKARGAGAWRDEDGSLVLHCGDKVWIVKPEEPGANGAHVDEMKPGSYGEHVYPAAPPLRKPADFADARAGKAGPGAEVLALLKSWHWKRPELDPLLLLGEIGCFFLGGALKWRPLMWVTGDAGTGKSTLQEFLQAMLGDRLLQSSDASAAGIWQVLRISSNAVAIDEGEPEEAGDRRMQALIKLGRQAASGGLILRGGADHEGSAFKARSCFLFSSILVPQLQPQDRTRFVVTELKPLKDKAGGAGAFHVPADGARRLGNGLLARIVVGWWRWDATLAAYHRELMARGLSTRSADLWGTVLAAQDLILFDGDGLEERAKATAGKIVEHNAHAAGADVGGEAFYECLNQILTHVPEHFRGGVKSRIEKMVRGVRHPPDVDADPQEKDDFRKDIDGLANCGIRVVLHAKGCEEPMLAIANQGQGIAGIFRGTKWAGGVWVQALLRHRKARKGRQRIGGGHPQHCVLLPLAEVLGDTLEEDVEAKE